MTNRDKLFEDRYFEKKNNEELADLLSYDCCFSCVASDYCESVSEIFSCQQTLEKWLEMEQSNE